MARGQQKTRRRPTKGAVAGRLIGAFVLGTAVMGGGLYWLDHQQAGPGGGRAQPGSHAVPPAGERQTAPSAAGGLDGAPSAKAPAGMPATGLDAAGPDAARPDAAGPDAAGPDAAGPDAAGPDAAGPEAPGKFAGKVLPQAPFGESEEVFETGARVYVAHCASCHGQPGRTGSAGSQFWGAGAAAVAAEPVGLLFQQTANGVPPGMQGFRGELRTTEIWDVALLLRNAGQDLPDPVLRLLRQHPPR